MPKLTPEEKRERKAAKAAEKLRLAELKIRKQKHDVLQREIERGELTRKRREKEWRDMLVKIALPRMRSELEFAWHNFERMVDSKDFTISLLLDEIKTAEDQYMMNLKCHTENIDSLILRFKDRLSELREDSEAQIEAMRISAEDEVAKINQTAYESEEYFKTMIYGLEMEKREQERVVRGDYLSKLDEEATKCGDIIQHLRAGLEWTITFLWDDITEFLKEFTERTDVRRKAYITLSQQDTYLQKVCYDQHVKLLSLLESIKKLRQQYASLQEIDGQRIADLLQERQYFADAFWTLRMRLAADRATDANNLQILSVGSNQATNHLEKIEKKGARILGLAAVCRKLETQEEKILPFPLRSPEDINAIRENINIQEYKSTCNLYLFWYRVARADAIRHSINEEREYLKRGNRILKTKIQDYCQCIECPPEEPQPKASTKRPRGPINVVDGYQIQKCYNKRLNQNNKKDIENSFLYAFKMKHKV